MQIDGSGIARPAAPPPPPPPPPAPAPGAAFGKALGQVALGLDKAVHAVGQEAKQFLTGPLAGAKPAEDHFGHSDGWKMKNDCVANAAYQHLAASHPGELNKAADQLSNGQPATLPGGGVLKPLTAAEEKYVLNQPTAKQDQARFEIAFTNMATNATYDPKTGDVTGKTTDGPTANDGVSMDQAQAAYDKVPMPFYDAQGLSDFVDRAFQQQQHLPDDQSKSYGEICAEGLQQQMADKGGPLVVVVTSASRHIDPHLARMEEMEGERVDMNYHHAVAVTQVENGQVSYHDSDGQHTVSAEDFAARLNYQSDSIGTNGAPPPQAVGGLRAR